MNATEVDGERRIVAGIHLVVRNGTQHILDANRHTIVYTCLLGSLQICVAAILHPA
jgi:hypothetical protein